MFPMTLTIHNHDQLVSVLAAMGTPAAFSVTAAEVKAERDATGVSLSEAKAAVKAKKSSAVSAEEKATVLSGEQQAAVDDTAGLTPYTEVHNQTVAEAAAKKAALAAATKPTAEAAKGDAPATKVEYSELQAAVLTLHKLDDKAAKPIAEAMGFPNFKAMPEERWAEALEKVKAKTEEVKGGV